MPEFEVVDTIVNRIINDLTDRRGLRQTFESFDFEIQGEIINTWKQIIIEELQNRDML